MSITDLPDSIWFLSLLSQRHFGILATQHISLISIEYSYPACILIYFFLFILCNPPPPPILNTPRPAYKCCIECQQCFLMWAISRPLYIRSRRCWCEVLVQILMLSPLGSRVCKLWYLGFKHQQAFLFFFSICGSWNVSSMPEEKDTDRKRK